MMDNNKFSISIFFFFQNVYIIKFHITTVINEYFYLKKEEEEENDLIMYWNIFHSKEETFGNWRKKSLLLNRFYIYLEMLFQIIISLFVWLNKFRLENNKFPSWFHLKKIKDIQYCDIIKPLCCCWLLFRIGCIWCNAESFGFTLSLLNKL